MNTEIDVLAEPLWSEHDLQKYLNISLSFIRRDRLSERPSIPFVKFASSVRYVPAAIRQVVSPAIAPAQYAPPSQDASVPAGASTNAPDAPVKRGPGRPRKVVLPAPAPVKTPSFKIQPWMKAKK